MKWFKSLRLATQLLSGFIAVAVIAIPPPAFSNVAHTGSPMLHPYLTRSSRPPAPLIASMWPS